MSEDLWRIRRLLDSMSFNPVRNYIAPGLTSWLIGGMATEHGLVRRFVSEIDQWEFITPHSHRFAFTQLVLEGAVINTVFRPMQGKCIDPKGAAWVKSVVRRGSEKFGHYEIDPDEAPSLWFPETRSYGPGTTYTMAPDEVHSVKFTRGADVLVFQGPDVSDETTILEPWCDGRHVKTFRVADWMFERKP